MRIKAPDGDQTPIGAGAAGGGTAPPTPVASETPASTPITGPFKPASWVAHEQDLRTRRNARLFLAGGAMFVVACAFVAGGLGAVREGLGFIGSRNMGNGVALVLLLPFVIAHISGRRWAGWVILVLCALSALFSLLATVALAGVKPILEFERGLAITGIPVLGMLGNVLWLAASAVLFLGTPSVSRNAVGLGGILLSGALMFPLATTDFLPRLANPITDARPGRLGDPALGFSYVKPEGYSGFRLDEGSTAVLTLSQGRAVPSPDIFLNESQTIGFFHHVSNSGLGKEAVPPSMFALLDDAEFLKERTFEVNGAEYSERRYRLPASGDRPEIVCATVCTELEERWLHFTVLVHSARHGGTASALETASQAMQDLLAGFEVDTPPAGRKR